MRHPTRRRPVSSGGTLSRAGVHPQAQTSNYPTVYNFCFRGPAAAPASTTTKPPRRRRVKLKCVACGVWGIRGRICDVCGAMVPAQRPMWHPWLQPSPSYPTATHKPIPAPAPVLQIPEASQAFCSDEVVREVHEEETRKEEVVEAETHLRSPSEQLLTSTSSSSLSLPAPALCPRCGLWPADGSSCDLCRELD